MYRKDNKKLYVRSDKMWKVIALEKEVIQWYLSFERNLFLFNVSLKSNFSCFVFLYFGKGHGLILPPKFPAITSMESRII